MLAKNEHECSFNYCFFFFAHGSLLVSVVWVAARNQGAHYMLVRVLVRVRFGKEYFVRILFEQTRIRTFGRGITRFIRMRILYSVDIETYTSLVTSRSILLRETII